MFFKIATTWIGIEYIDQLCYRGFAVADDKYRFATGAGSQLATDDQQAMFIARNEAFDQDATSFFQCGEVGSFDFSAGIQINKDASSMVGVGRFDDHRQADIFGGLPGVGRAIDDPSLRDRYATRFEQGFSQILVARNAFGDGAGAVGFGSPDATLFNPVAQLHQVAFRQSDRRDPALVSGINDTGRAGAET